QWSEPRAQALLLMATRVEPEGMPQWRARVSLAPIRAEAQPSEACSESAEPALRAQGATAVALERQRAWVAWQARGKLATAEASKQVQQVLEAQLEMRAAAAPVWLELQVSVERLARRVRVEAPSVASTARAAMALWIPARNAISACTTRTRASALR